MTTLVRPTTNAFRACRRTPHDSMSRRAAPNLVGMSDGATILSCMTLYPAKAPADVDKVRGGYYTPQPVARFLAESVDAGNKLLEPSCGDGRILRELALRSDQAHGVELVREEAAKARQFAPVVTKSLFDWLTKTQRERWDGVAGNPPYIRFGNWPPEQRQPALTLVLREGLNPTKLTNAWVPCVIASAIAVRDGGQVGLVLPAELLQVSYAAQLRDYILGHFNAITLITFERLLRWRYTRSGALPWRQRPGPRKDAHRPSRGCERSTKGAI